MAPAWAPLIGVGIFLQALGLFCYIMSQRQKKAFDAASAASGGTLVLILPLRDPSETLPPYSRNDDGVAAPPPPTYDADPPPPMSEAMTPDQPAAGMRTLLPTDAPGPQPTSPGASADVSVVIDMDNHSRGDSQFRTPA
ncbi:hypothetical protein BGZ68_001824 [Mortierella alpina]|nr:hypothetical protein BGZ68_001824 [Mortierella alpina]